MIKRQFNIEPRIETLTEKKLVGKRIRMSLSHNRTSEPWRSFMPGRTESYDNLTPELFAMQVYDHSLALGNYNHAFGTWAAIEISAIDTIPDGMKTSVLNSGLYAVFQYKGVSTDVQIMHYIFGTWLPNSNYILDNRPRFEILGEEYGNDNLNSEEEIWIPIQPKNTA
jgi:AraC family transcriptional regulator